MLFFGKERAFDKKLIVSAAVPITPYKKFMKEKPLPKKLLELHWSVFLQQTPDKTEALPAGDIHGIPQEQFHRLRRGAVSLMLFKKLPQPDFFSLYQQSKNSIGGTMPFLEAITVISAR